MSNEVQLNELGAKKGKEVHDSSLQMFKGPPVGQHTQCCWKASTSNNWLQGTQIQCQGMKNFE